MLILWEFTSVSIQTSFHTIHRKILKSFWSWCGRRFQKESGDRWLRRIMSKPSNFLPVQILFRGLHMDQCSFMVHGPSSIGLFFINILERGPSEMFWCLCGGMDLCKSYQFRQFHCDCYVNKQGRTRSTALYEEIFLLFHLLQTEKWFLKVNHLLGTRNLIADSLSRQNQCFT